MIIPKYRVLDPTGNITVLVSGAPDKSVAEEIMRREPTAEQVGFLVDDGLSLVMAGGEFCGNASMCAGLLRYLEKGEKESVLCVSGADEKIKVTVDGEENGSYRCTVKMPRWKSVKKLELRYGEENVTLPLVELQGIHHVIFPDRLPETEQERKTAENAARLWCRRLDACALGIMFYSRKNRSLVPLVYVPGADTVFWESSCASGTCAVGAYEATESMKEFSGELSEPAGILSVRATPEKELYLSGYAKIIK